MVIYMISWVLQVAGNSTLPSFPAISGLPPVVSYVIVGVILGYGAGLVLRAGKSLLLGLVIVFGSLYFIEKDSFPSMFSTSVLLPVISDVGQKIFAVINPSGPAGIFGLAGFFGAMVAAYTQLGVQSPLSRPES